MSNDSRPTDVDPSQAQELSDSSPQRLIQDIAFRDLHQPPIDFWQHTLETPARRILEDTVDPAFWDGWLKRRKPRQVAMLRHLLGFPTESAVRERKAELCEHADALRKFAPAVEFAARKSMHATLDVATGCLAPAVIEIAQEADGSFDTTALVFAMLDRAWVELEKVFHLDKLHKVGFARMRLRKPPRRPDRKLKEFLASGELLAVLKRFDSDRQDRLKSELQQIIELQDAQVVFIRRPHQQSLILADDKIVHGFTPGQIVLSAMRLRD